MHKPFKIKDTKYLSRIFYSPLAGCSDYPYRQMAGRYNTGLVFCEMVKMEALMRRDANTYRLLDYTKDMHPIGAQLCGSDIKLAKDAARIIEDLGFDHIDLNCGCPVDKVTKDGSGSGLLKNPNHIGDLICEMVQGVSIPVSVKIRAGWDDDSIVGPQVTQIAEAAGAKIIFVHGRTRVQAYKGAAVWGHIKACKDAAKDILVFGNGDIFCAQDALDMVKETNCDGVLASRGTFGQPWLAEDISRAFQGLPALDRGFDFCKSELQKHFEMTKLYAHEKKAVLDMRRVGCWYFKKGDDAKEFRRAMSGVKSLDQIEDIILNFKPKGSKKQELALSSS